MGLESANYVFTPSQVEVGHVVSAIQNLGGHENSDALTGTREFRIQGERYWIDLQWLIESQSGKPIIFIRVALCNPLDVAVPLKNLFVALFQLGEATLTDRRSKQSWNFWSETNWQQVWASYQQQRSEFRQAFGNYEGAISADKVFENLRNRRNELG